MPLLFPFLLHLGLDPGEMAVKPLVRRADQLPVEPPFAGSRLIAGHEQDGLGLGSKADATRQTPSCASKRSSFMLACREPFSVSTRGLPRVGPNCSRSLLWASSSSCTASGRSSYSGSNSS